MNITAQFKKVFIPFDQLGVVSPIQQMTVSPVLSIGVYGIGRGKAMHEAAQIAPGRFRNVVKMIGHQSHPLEPDLQPSDSFPQAFQKTEPIAIILKKKIRLSAPILQFSGRDMINSPRKFDSQRSRHRRTVLNRRYYVKC